MPVSSACFLWLLADIPCLFGVSKSEVEALTTLLIVCRRLGHCALEIEIRDVIIRYTSRCGGSRLDHNLVDVLNLRNLDLLLSILARRAPTADGLRLIGAIPATAATHERSVVAELKALVGLARAHGGLML